MCKPTEVEGLVGFCASMAVYIDQYQSMISIIPSMPLVIILMFFWFFPITIKVQYKEPISVHWGWKPKDES